MGESHRQWSKLGRKESASWRRCCVAANAHGAFHTDKDRRAVDHVPVRHVPESTHIQSWFDQHTVRYVLVLHFPVVIGIGRLHGHIDELLVVACGGVVAAAAAAAVYLGRRPQQRHPARFGHNVAITLDDLVRVISDHRDPAGHVRRLDDKGLRETSQCVHGNEAGNVRCVVNSQRRYNLDGTAPFVRPVLGLNLIHQRRSCGAPCFVSYHGAPTVAVKGLPLRPQDQFLLLAMIVHR
jgi:hypothetical protein